MISIAKIVKQDIQTYKMFALKIFFIVKKCKVQQLAENVRLFLL